MKEKALNSIISLYALVAVFKRGKGFTLITNTLEVYLSTWFSRQTTDLFLEIFKERIKTYISQTETLESGFDAFLNAEIEAHCIIISREISLQQRLLAMMYLVEYLPYMSGKSSLYIEDESYRLMEKIAEGLMISRQDFSDAVSFSRDNFQNIGDTNPVAIVTDNPRIQIEGVNARFIQDLNGQIIFLRMVALDTILFKVSGDVHFEINDRKLFKHRTYILKKGAVIYAGDSSSIYYNDIFKLLIRYPEGLKLVLEARNVEFRFGNGVYGVQKTTFQCASGEMVAIMGGSGSGKTTLMNVLIGARKPSAGSVTVNGMDVFSNPAIVKGYIGYVPQDDALNEDLTAFENLYFITGLASASLSREERIAKVDSLLKELELSKIRDLKVGSPLDKIISGGQRKRLNIAISLIRDPGVLFLDEPTSGLSSADSENIMQLLKETTLKGRLVVVNIHQPSSDIFKLFDKLLFIDQGGFPVYYGPSLQMISYLRSSLKLIDAQEGECHVCGNINPDEIFHMVSSKHVVTSQRPEARRIFPPLRWHRRFLKNLPPEPATSSGFAQLKPNKLDIPNPFRQFRIYAQRNFFTKIADVPYLLLSVFLSPILAVLLSVFARYVVPTTGEYSYYDNDNIPAFIFMSVIVAMFVGIMDGSSEIIKDRKALKRESFLNLSFVSYVSSKFSWLAVMSAIQMASYVLISIHVLEIPAGGLRFFAIMWSTAVGANLMGLLLSAVFKTAASVYVTIPFLLIPQILFSGAVIDFNKIHPWFVSDKYVPFISEVMVSRWAYEAINVSLFLESGYSEKFYLLDKEINNASYHRNFLLPEIEKHFFGDNWSTEHYLTPDSAKYKLLVDGFKHLERFTGENYEHLYQNRIEGAAMNLFIRDFRNRCRQQSDSLQALRDEVIERMGRDAYNRLERTRNHKLSQVVLDETNVQKVKVSEDEFIRKMGPIFHIPDNDIGRAHFYAPARRVAGCIIPTPCFNLYVIWLVAFITFVVIVRFRPKF